jgi:membrane-associated phospholipid phosphatase
VTVFVLVLGWPALLLAPLVPLVGWARWQVRAHTVAQAVVGALIAVAVTLGTFWLFHAL